MYYVYIQNIPSILFALIMKLHCNKRANKIERSHNKQISWRVIPPQTGAVLDCEVAGTDEGQLGSSHIHYEVVNISAIFVL